MEAENTDQSVKFEKDCLAYAGAPLKQGSKFIVELKGNTGYGYRPPSLKSSNTLQLQRIRLAERRMLTFHINSAAWINQFAQAFHHWVALLHSALADQVGFIFGDGNQFAQRNFKTELGRGVNTCILIVDLLERILSKVNATRSSRKSAARKARP